MILVGLFYEEIRYLKNSIATRMGVNVWNTLQVFDDYKGPLAHLIEIEWVHLLRLRRRLPRSGFYCEVPDWRSNS